MAVPTRIQSATGADTTFASSVSATFSNSNSNGNVILLAWEGDSATTTNKANTPTDTAGNTYQRVASVVASGVFDLEIWIAFNIKAKAGNVVTVTDTLAGADGTMVVEEWSGVTVVSLPFTQASTSGSSTAISSGSLTSTGTNALFWGAGAAASGSSQLSLAGSFTNLTQTNTTFSNIGISSQVVTTPTSVNYAMTTGSASWCGAMVMLTAQNSPKVGGLRPHPFSPGLAR